ncbi:MAG: DUF3500 domain-containing protein [Hyphomicrobiaceae bacterium]|nr:DUF3500 domain-containing protein [Hyphomicrobiaceae bacterium]
MRAMPIVLMGLAVCLVLGEAQAQQPGRWRAVERAKKALAEPFVGITTDGRVRTGLFTRKKTGLSTLVVRQAAEAVLRGLSEAQRKRTLFPVDHSEWRDWANIHRFPRQGVSLAELGESQRQLVYALLSASLSARGYDTSRNIMRLNGHLAELVQNIKEYGEHLYWLTMMGEPSATEPWGWQIEGHHLAVNFFVLGDQVVMTPTFMGSEPVEALSGRYKGIAVLQVEQDLGLKLMTSLPPEQQRLAYSGERTGQAAMLAAMFSDNIIVPFKGVRASQLSPAHRAALLELVGRYVGMMPDDHAALKMVEVQMHLDETYFSWMGGTEANAAFYYRIHSPVILIEFDHQGPIALPGDRSVPTRRHIHTVVRTPNGNDYGRDLLRQHLLEAHRGQPHHVHPQSGQPHRHPHRH